MIETLPLFDLPAAEQSSVLSVPSGRVAPTPARVMNVLTCLRDAIPETLEVVSELADWRGVDTKGPCLRGDWAYRVCPVGVRAEQRGEWDKPCIGEPSGWDRAPAYLLTWAELTDLIGHDPRRAEITTWVDTLPELRWRQMLRPHELWPDPWLIGHFCDDHLDRHWPGRRRAWQLVLDLLTDAIDSHHRQEKETAHGSHDHPIDA